MKERKRPVRHTLTREDVLLRSILVVAGLWLTGFILLPLLQVILHSVSDSKNNFIGLTNYTTYFSTPGLTVSFTNSLFVATSSTILTVTFAFIAAYSLTRTCMRGKGFFRIVAMLPLYAPSLLHGIAFVYLFGKQGLFTQGFFGYFSNTLCVNVSINIGLYTNPTGIILAEMFNLFPHALLILLIALSLADARLYEAALALRATPIRIFFTVTFPGALYGLLSASIVCFTAAFTDFGIPRVLGPNYPMLSTEIYNKVIGQQDFAMSSTISILLLVPTAIGFILNRVVQRQQIALLTSGIVPLQPKPSPWRDWTFFAVSSLITLAILTVIGTALMASIIKRWPYNLSLSAEHYNFETVAGRGFQVYLNSVQLAFWTATFGTIMVFMTAYVLENVNSWQRFRAVLYFLCMLPVAVPGMVLGLSYIFFFNHPANPLNFIYGTMLILVSCTVVHFFTVTFYTATAALKQISKQFDEVAASLSTPFWVTLWRVIIPISLPAILEIGVYYFVNALTTVSAVIFLYAASLQLASVAIVNLNDSGDTAPAAAMSVLIFFTGLGIRILYEFVTYGLKHRVQSWRQGNA